MRINWHWRGIDLIDIEIHALRIRPPDDDPPAGPRIHAVQDSQDVSLAEPVEQAFGFNALGR